MKGLMSYKGAWEAILNFAKDCSFEMNIRQGGILYLKNKLADISKNNSVSNITNS